MLPMSGCRLVLLIAFFTSCQGTCLVTMETLTGPLFVDSYERNGQLLDTVIANYSVSAEGETSEMTSCVVHLDQFKTREIATHLRRETHLLGTVLCLSRLKLERLEWPRNIHFYDSIVFVHFTFYNCTVSTQFLENLVNYYKIYGLALIDTNLYRSRDNRNVVKLSVAQLTLLSETRKISISSLPLDGVQYDSIEGLGLIGLSFTELPQNFTSHFPTLQLLALSSNCLSSPPLMYFSNRITVLPNNVTRTKRMAKDTEYVWELDDIALNRVPRVLDLRDNQISLTKPKTIRGFIDLLYLSRNQIVSIHDDTFREVRGMQCLHLDHNNIQIVTSGMFIGLRHLQTLYLSHNDLIEIQDDAFADLSTLEFLSLQHNSLTTVTRQQLRGLRKLKLLALQNNKLSEIEKDAFSCIPSLTDINLRSNPLSEISPQMLLLNNLKTADLGKTGLRLENFIEALSEVPSFIIAERLRTGRLPIIGLLENGITSVYNLTLHGLEHFDHLFRKNVLFGLPSFCLDVSKNELSCDCDMGALLSYFTFVKTHLVNLGINGLSWELCWVGWTCHWPLEFRETSIFDLKPDRLYCPLISEKDLCPKNCRCFQRYKNGGKVIDCSRRDLTELPIMQPSGLLDIRLMNNRLTNVQPRQYLGRIERLNLSHNDINEFPSLLPALMTNLTHLHIDHNNLIDFPVLTNHTGLKQVNLGHNPFQCSCNNLWFQTWLIQNKDVVIEWERIKCFTRQGVLKPVIMVTSVDLGCSVITKLPLIIALGCVALFIVVAFVLVVYFHEELRVLWFIYHTKSIIRSQKPLVGKQFITSVIFSEDDRVWVTEHIVKPLELHFPGWPYALRFDSFLPGYSMKASIDRLLQSSGTVTVLLSPTFMRDEWSLYALEQSLFLAVQNKINFVNLIKMKNVPVQQVKNEILHNYIRLKRYLDPNSNLFTEKLIFSIFGGKVVKKSGEVAIPQNRDISISVGSISIFDDSADDVSEFDQIRTRFRFDVGIIYGDRDRHWVIHGLLPVLEGQVEKVCLPDRDDVYIPGAADKENIVHLIKSCRILFLVVSQEFVSTERCLFTFRAATGGVLTAEQTFILLFSEDVDLSAVRDLKAYRENHVCLNKTNEQFINKLKRCLRPSLYNQ